MKRKPSIKYAARPDIGRRIDTNVRAAIQAYRNRVVSRRLLGGSALYDRPWFLVIGAQPSGKSSMLSAGAQSWPLRYKHVGGDSAFEPAEQIEWFFGENAVWIDTPSKILATGAQDSWQALGLALGRVRRRRPVDGIVVVVPVEMFDSEHAAARAAEIGLVRERLIALIEQWGIEIPICVVVSKCDTVSGFETHSAVAGFTPGDIVAPEYRSKPGCVTDLIRQVQKACWRNCFNMMGNIRERGKHADVARFATGVGETGHGIEQLATELCRPTGYTGRPLFAGAFLLGQATVSVAARPAHPVSDTIVSHPLNPARVAQVSSATPVADSGVAYAAPILARIAERLPGNVQHTKARRRKLRVRAVAVNAAAMVTAAIAAVLIVAAWRSALSDIRLAGRIARTATKKAVVSSGTFGALENSVLSMKRLERGAGPGLNRIVGLAVPSRLYETVRYWYWDYLERNSIGAARKRLAGVISAEAATGALEPDRYERLYSFLKTYLTLSREGCPPTEQFDSATAVAVLRSVILETTGNRGPEAARFVELVAPAYVSYVRQSPSAAPLVEESLVRFARASLRRIPGPESLYRPLAKRFVSSEEPITFEDLTGITRSDGLVCTVSVSSAYSCVSGVTKVLPALRDVARQRETIDWVIGGKGIVADTANIHTGLVAAYAEDCRSQWLHLLARTRVQIAPDRDLGTASRLLRTVGAPEGALVALLKGVSRHTATVSQQADAAAAHAKKSVSGALAGIPLVSRTASRAVESAASLVPPDPLERVAAVSNVIGRFVDGGAEAPFSLVGYYAALCAVAEALEKAGSSDDAVLSVFSGANDPVDAAWKYTRAGLRLMPEEIGDSLAPLLLGPFEQAGVLVAQRLSESLNARWEQQVYRFFDDQLARRYPLAPRREEAAPKDIGDFFRPSTGVLWTFIERTLAGRLEQTSRGWKARDDTPVMLEFAPELFTALISAGRIRETMFVSSGEGRVFGMAVSLAQSSRSAELEIDGQKAQLTLGGAPSRLRWPVENEQGAAMRVKLPDGSVREVAFAGPWGLLRLLDAAQLVRGTESSFTAAWMINVQNMFTIAQTVRFECAGSAAGLVERVFDGFVIPRVLILEPRNKPGA